MKIHIKGPEQIGDSIYARPFVQKLHNNYHDLYMTTVHPWLYSDMNIKFVKPESIKLRTPKVEFLYETTKGMEFHTLPADIDKEIEFHYTAPDLKKNNIWGHMDARAGLESASIHFDLPKTLPEHRVRIPGNKKLAVIRPVTLRAEFPAATRNPEPNYIGWIAKILKNSGYHVVSLADLVPGEEWIEGDVPPADLRLHHGELGIAGALSLIRDADIVVGGSGFLIPAAIAAGTKLFIVFGGRGGIDNPTNLLDLRMNLSKVGWAMPDNFCRCGGHTHDCDKKISDLDSQFFKFMSRTNDL